VISATATYTLAASVGGGPVYAEGEELERVRVVATMGGGERLEYITTSGRAMALNSR